MGVELDEIETSKDFDFEVPALGLVVVEIEFEK